MNQQTTRVYYACLLCVNIMRVFMRVFMCVYVCVYVCVWVCLCVFTCVPKVDMNQQTMLLAARARGADWFELFSNSPVW